MKGKKKSIHNNLDAEIIFQIVLIIIIIPVFSFLTITIFENIFYEKTCSNNEIFMNKGKINIVTDKRLYYEKEKIILAVENDSEESVYLEPCEYLNNLEKKINGNWEPYKETVQNKVYDDYGFEKRKRITICELGLPKAEPGIYRVVVRVYYDCKKPGENMCEKSSIFYSNEFEIVNNNVEFEKIKF